jgi:hypothetical protein
VLVTCGTTRNSEESGGCRRRIKHDVVRWMRKRTQRSLQEGLGLHWFHEASIQSRLVVCPVINIRSWGLHVSYGWSAYTTLSNLADGGPDAAALRASSQLSLSSVLASIPSHLMLCCFTTLILPHASTYPAQAASPSCRGRFGSLYLED